LCLTSFFPGKGGKKALSPFTTNEGRKRGSTFNRSQDHYHFLLPRLWEGKKKGGEGRVSPSITSFLDRPETGEKRGEKEKEEVLRDMGVAA